MMRVFCVILAGLIALPLIAADNAAKPAKPLHVSKGAEIKLTDYVVKGKTTIFDFYSDYCPPCVQVAPMLERLHQQRADIVVVKVDINRPGQRGIDWRSPVAQQYKLESVPHFKVYGPDGKMIAEDKGDNRKAWQMVSAWLR